MQAEDLKQLNERFNEEVFRGRRVDAINELLTDDFVGHIPLPGRRYGSASHQGLHRPYAGCDTDFAIDRQIAEGIRFHRWA